MDEARIPAAVVTALLGVSFLAGFLRSFREHLYLGLLGLSFIALAADIAIPASRGLAWLKLTLLVSSGCLFAAAVIFAVAEVRAQMRLIQEARRGREREMWEYLRQLEQRHAAARAQDGPQPPPERERPN